MTLKYVIVGGCLVAIVNASGLDGWNLNGRFDGYVQSINVVGKTSDDREGLTHNEELNLNFTGPLKEGNAGIETRFRGTSDNRIQQDGAELLYLRSYYRETLWEIEGGDVAASYNPYIFSGSLKGAKFTYKSKEEKEKWDYSVIGGVKKGLWRELYTDDPDESPTSYAMAMEAKYTHERGKTISLSYAGLNDELDNNSSFLGSRGSGLGISGSWRFNSLFTLEGRGAFTYGTEDLKNNLKDHYENAIYFKLLTRPFTDWKSYFTYERVSSDFVSFGGYGNQDMERIENSTMWDINKELRANLSLKTSRDNLDGTLSESQRVYYEALQLSYYPEFLKRGDVSIHLMNQESVGREENQRFTGGFDINVRNSNGLRYGGGYDYSYNKDQNGTSTTEIANIYKVLVGYKQNLSDSQSYRTLLSLNYQDIRNQQNKVGVKIDAGYDYSKRISADFSYISDMINYDIGNDTTNETFQLRGSYALDEQRRSMLRLLLEKRAIDVQNTTDQSYDEYIGKLSFSHSF